MKLLFDDNAASMLHEVLDACTNYVGTSTDGKTAPLFEMLSVYVEHEKKPAKRKEAIDALSNLVDFLLPVHAGFEITNEYRNKFLEF